MQLTDGEILASYRQAKHKAAQIKVLAELNCCEREDIIAILRAGGETKPRGRAGQKSKSEEEAWERKTSAPEDAFCDAPADQLSEEDQSPAGPEPDAVGSDPPCVQKLGGMELAALYKMLSEVCDAFPSTRVVLSAKRRIGGATLLVHYDIFGDVDDTTLVLNEQ